MNKFKLFASSLAIAAAGVTPNAHAGGFLADTLVRPWNPQLATALDNAHRAMGRPLNAAPAIIGDTLIAPGVGTGMTAAWEAQRAFRRSLPVQQEQPMPQWQQPLGNRCMTPAGISGLGPVNPVGSFCTWTTPWGAVVPGHVVQ